ncbi:hypothetical protein KR009_003886, partial [Drosophila setifemur]
MFNAKMFVLVAMALCLVQGCCIDEPEETKCGCGKPSCSSCGCGGRSCGCGGRRCNSGCGCCG